MLLGDDAFLGEMCRKGVMRALVPEDMKDFCLHDLDLGQTSIFEALDLSANAFADGSVPGAVFAECEDAVRAGVEEGRVQGDRRIFSTAESVGAGDLCGGSYCAAAGSAPDGYDG